MLDGCLGWGRAHHLPAPTPASSSQDPWTRLSWMQEWVGQCSLQGHSSGLSLPHAGYCLGNA